MTRRLRPVNNASRRNRKSRMLLKKLNSWLRWKLRRKSSPRVARKVKRRPPGRKKIKLRRTNRKRLSKWSRRKPQLRNQRRRARTPKMNGLSDNIETTPTIV